MDIESSGSCERYVPVNIWVSGMRGIPVEMFENAIT